MKLQVDIYENMAQTPVLSHIFYGKTREEIDDVVQAHAKTDSFFRAALTTGNFRGMSLRATSQWFA